MSERISARVRPDIVQQADPRAAEIIRFFSGLSPDDVARLKNVLQPTVLDPPAKLAGLTEQLATWAEPPPAPLFRGTGLLGTSLPDAPERPRPAPPAQPGPSGGDSVSSGGRAGPSNPGRRGRK